MRVFELIAILNRVDPQAKVEDSSLTKNLITGAFYHPNTKRISLIPISSEQNRLEGWIKLEAHAQRRYLMEDRSIRDSQRISETRRHDLSLQDVANMTEWADSDFDRVSFMKVGDEFTIDAGDIYIKRTS